LEHHQELHPAVVISHDIVPQIAAVPITSFLPVLAEATHVVSTIDGETAALAVYALSIPVNKIAVLSNAGRIPTIEGEPTVWFMNQVVAQHEPKSLLVPPFLEASVRVPSV